MFESKPKYLSKCMVPISTFHFYTVAGKITCTLFTYLNWKMKCMVNWLFRTGFFLTIWIDSKINRSLKELVEPNNIKEPNTHIKWWHFILLLLLCYLYWNCAKLLLVFKLYISIYLYIYIMIIGMHRYRVIVTRWHNKLTYEIHI